MILNKKYLSVLTDTNEHLQVYCCGVGLWGYRREQDERGWWPLEHRTGG